MFNSKHGTTETKTTMTTLCFDIWNMQMYANKWVGLDALRIHHLITACMQSIVGVVTNAFASSFVFTMFACHALSGFIIPV